jgi:hypothetical protein
MARRNYRVLGASWLSLGLILSVANATAAPDWPEGYVVYEGTESPDQRYGILVATADAWEKDGSVEGTNYLADLKKHRVLGKIRGADYFAHQNHRGLKAIFADDSSWCVVQYDERFGFGSIAIIEPKDASFVQTDIGKKVERSLAVAMKIKPPGEEESGNDATAYFRISDHHLLVRAVANTDPKSMDPKRAHYALFYGTYDVQTKKWQSANAQALKADEEEGADAALSDFESDFKDRSFQTQDDKAASLDDRMNAVYTLARVILPAARFAVVKQEQIKWLKGRDAAGTVEEKCQLIEARIKVLQKLLW